MSTEQTTPSATWNRRFQDAGDRYLFGEAPNAWLAAQAASLPAGARALCVADGEGRNSVHLARCGLEVAAFDFAPAAVDKARRLAGKAGVQVDFAVASVDDYAWPAGTCDVVAAIFVQFAPPDMRARMFRRMAEALAPGGRLLLLGYGPRQIEYRTGGPGVPEQLYTEALLREAFAGPGLEIESLTCWEDTLDEGPAHHGRSDLIALVARAAPARTMTAQGEPSHG